MLLIPDIHITSKYTTHIIHTIKTFVDCYPQENNIVFLGDYVYAFNYDRKALLQLFELRVSLHHQGKNLYILAGNHDRIGDQFVYEEAKQSRDIINQYSDHKIYFITHPCIHQIEGQTIFFVPFVIDPSQLVLPSHHINITHDHTQKTSPEMMSGLLNIFIDQTLQKIGSCTMIHHYYIGQTEFWEHSGMFDARDIALDKKWLHHPGLTMISGHIHHPFVYNNYLCLGSVRHTNDTEIDQIKVLARWSPNDNMITLHSSRINPIISVQDQEQQIIDHQHIDHVLDQIIINHDLKSTPYWDIHADQLIKPELCDVKIIYHSSKYFEDAKSYIDPSLREVCRHIQIKKHILKTNILITDLQIQQQKLQNSLTAWREICKQYIQSKYPDQANRYIDLLMQLKIL